VLGLSQQPLPRGSGAEKPAEGNPNEEYPGHGRGRLHGSALCAIVETYPHYNIIVYDKLTYAGTWRTFRSAITELPLRARRHRPPRDGQRAETYDIDTVVISRRKATRPQHP
jgi:hypothetical protein